MRPLSIRRVSAALLLVAMRLAAPAFGAQNQPPLAPGDLPNVSASKIEQVSDDEVLLTGDVDLRYGEIRLLADTVHFNNATHVTTAEGNVVLLIGKGEISGDRLEMNMETKLATVWNAHGYMDPDVIFHAEKLERTGEDTIVITDGVVTTCTQPSPYWAFHVSKATLHLEHYAHMHNVTIDVADTPVFYLPYLLWPLKTDRSTGLLLPNVGYSRSRGSFIGNAVYVVLGRSQDTTLYYDRYGKTGTGYGFEYRFVPAPKGQGTLLGYYLEDTVNDPTGVGPAETRKRYRFKFTETQQFNNGFRLLADLNEVSDLDYYLDFERDITQTTSPTVFSHIDLARNWSNYSLNARVDRQEQFLSSQEDLTLQRLPELELRGRGIRFGRSPFYLSFEASAGLFDRNRRLDVPRQPADPNNPEDTVSRRQSTTYQRYDLFPTIAASFSPTPWLDVSPSVSARETIYTRSLADPLDPNSPTSADDITREFAAFNLSLVGPRFFRVFGDIHRTDLPIRKHTFEPQVKYTYIPEVSDGENVIRFDEVDTLTGVRNEVTYSLISRLFTRAAASVAPPPPTPPTEPYASDITGPTQIQAPVTDLKDLPSELKEALKDSQRAAGVGAVEVATFDLSQTYSLDADRPRSVATPVQPDGTPERLDSQAGPVVASVRYNPTSAVSFDLRTSYDILFDDIKNVSLSANLRSLQHGYMRFSWFLERDFEGRFVDPNGRAADPNAPVKGDALRFFDSSQVRLIGGTSFFDRKITLDLEGSYDIENRNLLDQRYRLGYNTQCCGMLVEIARRDFDTIDEVEYRFVLNLRGVGTFLDLQGRPR